MPESKPRRSIFDTLKKSADGRLGLAEAARMAERISVFPQKKPDPTVDPTDAPTPDPTHVPTGAPTGAPADGPAKEPTPGPTGDPTRPSGRAPEHGPAHDPNGIPTPDPTVAPTIEPTVAAPFETAPTPDPTPDPTGDPAMRRLIRGLPEQKRRFLRFILANEPRGDDYIVSRRAVAQALGLTEISVKRYFAQFADLGFFRKETYLHGVCQGVRLFLVRSRCQAFGRCDPILAPTLDPTGDPTRGHEPTRAPTRGLAKDPTPDPTPSSAERKKENLSVSLSPAREARTDSPEKGGA